MIHKNIFSIMNSKQLQNVIKFFKNLQDEISGEIEKIEKQAFHEDSWRHKNGGGGRTRILKGKLFESAGVNFSHVLGDQLPVTATQKRPELVGSSFEASGVSLVIHPNNPFIPTSHANIRVFRASNEKNNKWWFGGGFDLTPFYIFEEDVIHWHQVACDACKPFGPNVYTEFKKNCDDYFFLKHRNETRGVGGVFFDDLNEWGFEKSFEFVKAIGNAFLEAYLPIVRKRQSTEFTTEHKEFQKYRRGRYVEFNLVYDRGTLFGLQSGGRTESILMSMPPEVSFKYNYQPQPNSPEAKLYDYLKPREWIK